MSYAAFLPVLSTSDVEQAAFLIHNAYIPGQDVEQSRRMQQDLFEIQKKPAAWGLIVPLMDHPDQNVQFFGAHTAQVKIARDWDSFPQEHALDLRNVLLEVSVRAVATDKNRPTLRKLFVAITSLALKLVPGQPSKWPDWIPTVVRTLSEGGASSNYILMFLEIAVQEVGSSDLVAASKTQMQQSLFDAIPLVTQAAIASLTRPGSTESERHSAFYCLVAWIPKLPANELNAIIPLLIRLLSDESTFIGSSDVLQEILTSSPFSNGSGIKTLTEPLLEFLEQDGVAIVQQTLTSGMADEISHSLCKLLVTLGEHSVKHFAVYLTTPRVQTFIRLLFSYTTLPGYYGIEEEESEMTLVFWYLLQESLWNVDYGASYPDKVEVALADWAESVAGSGQGAGAGQNHNDATSQPGTAAAIYAELLPALKRKVTWPGKTELAGWTKDQKDKFLTYRRDVGDTLINAYYILRADALKLLVDELALELNSRRPTDGWENVEAILYCLTSVQEAVEVSENQHLELLFSPEILGQLPTTGQDRVRRTALSLIGAYSTWFVAPVDTRYLLGALNFVVDSLNQPMLCLPAANALRDLCDANRNQLAAHITAFGQLYTRMPSIPDSEKTKIVESIASVIQALPPEEEVAPVEAIVKPEVQKLAEALNSAGQLPEEARAVAILQLQVLTGCSKGLTRTEEVVYSFGEDPVEQVEMEKLQQARDDPRMVHLRDAIMHSIQGVIALWSNDATTADALYSLLISITALPEDMTLLSLPPRPLLQLVCGTLQRHPNAVWLSLCTMFIRQVDPPSLTSLLSVPSAEANVTVLEALPIILDATFGLLRQDDAMEANPDIVQGFFACMEMVAQHFAGLLFELPSGGLDALAQCAIRALSLQERYSLVGACNFLVHFINRTVPIEPLAEKGRAFMRAHGRLIMTAVLCGIAGIAPTSTSQNLIDLLTTMVQRCNEECRDWIPQILFSDDFVPSKASKTDKEKFAKTVLASRSTKRNREAASQFALVAKGLEGSSFGYASVTM